MSLTKSDLTAIKQVVDDSLKDHPTHADLDKKLTQKLRPIKRDLKIIRSALNATIKTQEKEHAHFTKCIHELDDAVGLPHVPPVA